jgi:predicted lipoprotein with Yx(FWY)xxD motif
MGEMKSEAINVRKAVGITSMAAGAAVAAALVLAGCSSGSGGGTAAGGGASTSAAAASSSSATSVIKVETHTGPMGTFLTDGSGKALYMFASDTSSKSNCTGACASYWPALTTKGKASAAGTAKGSDLASIKRSDGAVQVSYAGHPLYRFALDGKAGDTNGEGRTDFGGHWWLLAPSGKPITTSAGSGSSSSSSSSSGGGNYGY